MLVLCSSPLDFESVVYFSFPAPSTYECVSWPKIELLEEEIPSLRTALCYVVSHPEVCIEMWEHSVLISFTHSSNWASQCCYGNRVCWGINVYRKLAKKHRRFENELCYLWDWVEIHHNADSHFKCSPTSECVFIYFCSGQHFSWLPLQWPPAPSWPRGWLNSFGLVLSIPESGKSKDAGIPMCCNEWDLELICCLKSVVPCWAPFVVLCLCAQAHHAGQFGMDAGPGQTDICLTPLNIIMWNFDLFLGLAYAASLMSWVQVLFL